MTRIAFRLDDVCPEMNWSRFAAFEDLFIRWSIRPLLAIVPNNRDPALAVSEPEPCFWEKMVRLRDDGWSVAQHGFEHQCTIPDGGILGINGFSEFASLPYEIQLDKIRRGKELLASHGLDTTIWSTPAHTFDANTLRVLRDLGFRYMSDGIALYPYDFMGLRFLPSQIGRPWKPPLGVVTIYIHANTITDREFGEFAAFIETRRESIRDYRDLLEEKPHNVIRRITEPSALCVRKLKARLQAVPSW
jgi:predicted deacetylase